MGRGKEGRSASLSVEELKGIQIDCAKKVIQRDDYENLETVEHGPHL
ncbi:MAG: hypothetical protein Q9N34_08240 [Aquificota bacterium]|nr:hypothetical protein [Aquificota bacterium]